MNNEHEQQEMTWRQIESAPKDCEILVIDATAQCPTASVGIWAFDEAGDYDSWLCGYDMDGDGLWLPGATHWMPLPTAPQAEAEEGK